MEKAFPSEDITSTEISHAAVVICHLIKSEPLAEPRPLSKCGEIFCVTSNSDDLLPLYLFNVAGQVPNDQIIWNYCTYEVTLTEEPLPSAESSFELAKGQY